MSQVKKHLKVGVSLFIAALFALNCARSNKTPFAQNLENDAGKAAPTYEEWVALVGQGKTDALYSGIGQDSMNLLTYGIGQSNMVQLINAVTATDKLITLIGNDSNVGTGPGGRTGLGVVVTLYLILQVDAQMQANVSANLPAPGGSTPTDNDTIANLASVVNTLTSTEVQTKMVDLFGTTGAGLGFDLSRSLAAATTETIPNQLLYVQRMAKVVAHVSPTASSCAAKLCPVMQGLTAAEITGKLALLVKGVTSADKLVEVMETSSSANLIFLLANATGVTTPNITAKMVVIINAVTDCTKMGYVVTNVASLANLVNIINNVQVPANMGALLNLAENGGTWASQVSPAETWGTPTKAAPFGTAGAGQTRTYTVAGGVVPIGAITLAGASGGTNYLPGVTATIATCGVQPTLHLNIVGGVIQTTGHYATTAGSGCTNGAQALTTVTPATSKTTMARLVDVINGLAPVATYYKLLNLVDGVTDMNKMVRLIQDLIVADDVFDLLNNMSGLAGTAGTCTVANGTDTVTITGGGGAGATAVSFNVGGQIAYIRMTANGAGYTSQPTISVPGCAAVTYTAVGPVTGGAPITMISVNNPVNNLVQVVEQLSLANMPRLQQVMDGQRTFDNTGTQPNAALTTTYLGKLNVLMQNLSQTLEGPLKVGDLLAGVTNTDKIIDLIWGVTTTTNLSTVINGIFKSTEVPGCSDGSAGTFVGPSTTTASDTGTCENSGNGFFYGERDRAVTTLVYLVENVANANKLITMIDQITPANVIALVNHTATYSQHADGTSHVYPRGAVGLDAQAAGKRLTKIVDNTTTIGQLVYVTNNVSSMIKMSKLVSFMDIGVTATDGTGKMATLINAIGGTNCYLSTTVPGRGNTTAVAPGGSAACVTQNSQNATGMGKMVNVVDFISGTTTSAAMVQLKNLLNDVTDINKTADLINQTVNSSNIVGLLNGVTDPRYGTSTTDLVNMLNSLPRGEISKMVSLVGEIGNATGTATATFPGEDHVLIAQLMSPYVAANIATTSGVGQANMNHLIGNLSMTGGQNYTTAPTISLAGLGTFTTVATATSVISASLGTVTKVTLTAEGSCTVAPTGATVGGGGTGATVNVITAPVANSTTLFKVKSVYLTNGGSGYAASTLTFTGGTCGTAPTATTQVNGVIGATVTSGGVGYTDTITIPAGSITGGGGTGATATGLVAGAINSLTSFYGGAGYVNGQVCPIRGAGGSSGTCTVSVTSGAVTGCSAIGGGADYIDGQIVTIGGSAILRANVTAGAITGYTVISGGCGYSGSPNVVVTSGANDCATPPAAGTATVAAGVITGVTGGTGGTGCTSNPRVTVGESPYATHGDGATAIVNNVTAATGRVVAISFSSPADYLAQLLTNTEKGPGNAAINYNGTTTPNVSARQAMVRMLHHGVSHTSAGYASSPAIYPGIGPVHISQNVLNNLSGAGSVMTVINMLNSDSTSLTDLVVLIGCGDHVEYSITAPLTDNDFHFFCSSHTPTLW